MTLREKLVSKSRKQLYYTYKFTSDFPQREIYAVTNQLRRASLSILLNIIEGYSRYSVRKSNKELINYLTISYGSSEECQEILNVSIQLGYGNSQDLADLHKRITEISRLLRKLLQILDTRD